MLDWENPLICRFKVSESSGFDRGGHLLNIQSGTGRGLAGFAWPWKQPSASFCAQNLSFPPDLCRRYGDCLRSVMGKCDRQSDRFRASFLNVRSCLVDIAFHG